MKYRQNLLDKELRVRDVDVNNLIILLNHEIDKLNNDLSLICSHYNIHDNGCQFLVDLRLLGVKC